MYVVRFCSYDTTIDVKLFRGSSEYPVGFASTSTSSYVGCSHCIVSDTPWFSELRSSSLSRLRFAEDAWLGEEHERIDREPR
jgi:hypothetical protein